MLPTRSELPWSKSPMGVERDHDSDVRFLENGTAPFQTSQSQEICTNLSKIIAPSAPQFGRDEYDKWR